MNMRFSTVAANADILGEDTPNATGGTNPSSNDQRHEGGAPKRRRYSGGATRQPGGGKPGEDINAAGFVKDKDADKP
jgi:hypothetical protein